MQKRCFSYDRIFLIGWRLYLGIYITFLPFPRPSLSAFQLLSYIRLPWRNVIHDFARPPRNCIFVIVVFFFFFYSLTFIHERASRFIYPRYMQGCTSRNDPSNERTSRRRCRISTTTYLKYMSETNFVATKLFSKFDLTERINKYRKNIKLKCEMSTSYFEPTRHSNNWNQEWKYNEYKMCVIIFIRSLFFNIIECSIQFIFNCSLESTLFTGENIDSSVDFIFFIPHIHEFFVTLSIRMKETLIGWVKSSFEPVLFGLCWSNRFRAYMILIISDITWM